MFRLGVEIYSELTLAQFYFSDLSNVTPFNLCAHEGMDREPLCLSRCRIDDSAVLRMEFEDKVNGWSNLWCNYSTHRNKGSVTVEFKRITPTSE